MTKSVRRSAKDTPQPQGENKKVTLPFENQDVLRLLTGENQQNLRAIEEALEIRVSQSADGLIFEGQDSEVDLALDLVSQMSGLVAEGESFFPEDVRRSIQLLSSDRKARLESLFREQLKLPGRTQSIVPKTLKQREYIEAIRGNDIVFGIGPAGTGKTYLAMAMAVSALLSKEFKRVVLCRPAVEAGEKLGFLPGDMAEKVNPYLRPLYDALHDMVEYEKAVEMVERGLIEVAPLAFMRGRTLSRAFVILDEAQNTTSGQMKMFLTRLGQHSKCIVTGDITQIDLPRGVLSGLTEALNILEGIPGISMIHFSEKDVIRHALVSKIVTAYQRFEQGAK